MQWQLQPEATDFAMQDHPRLSPFLDSRQDLTTRVGNTALRDGMEVEDEVGGVGGNVPSFFRHEKVDSEEFQ